jgi:tRNA threonylcarbamoyladenosine biosynthesis protein TsaE
VEPVGKVALLRSRSAAHTRALGAALGRALQPGDFVGLVGDLGAGKTELVRGVALGAGVAEGTVSSPTFAIVYPYEGRIPLFHADLYRVADADELYATGFADLVGGGAVLVEWLDRVWSAAPSEILLIEMKPIRGSAKARVLRVTARGSRPASLLAQLTRTDPTWATAATPAPRPSRSRRIRAPRTRRPRRKSPRSR